MEQYPMDRIQLIDYHVPYLLKIVIEKRHDPKNNNNGQNRNRTNSDNVRMLSRLKLLLDPQMLNYQILQTLIVKGFRIEWYFCF
ncbi:hypothetical protein BLA29_013469 [Euroglyphus maynei]|uniref:Uncharacterized protein n=1 Tax=Euroglyphus maynei TaxID=6958 RepID=A0A1Y3BAT2_EURMA|nr:hypothetical protein BLA29_013469 [Euroglyphus maynei]